MTPADNRYDLIVVQNIDTDPFEFAVDKNVYLVTAGEARAFPRFIANYFVKHFIDHMLNKAGKRTSDVIERNKLAAQVVLEERPISQPRVRTQAELDAEMVEKMNTSTDLDGILARRKAELAGENTDAFGKPVEQPIVDTSTPFVAPPVADTTKLSVPTAPTAPETPAEEPKTTTPNTEEFAGLKPTAPEGEVEGEVVVPTATNEDGASAMPPQMTDGAVKATPTRSEVMAYAKDKLGLNVDDPKSIKEWKKMNVPALIKEFNYPVEGEE